MHNISPSQTKTKKCKLEKTIQLTIDLLLPSETWIINFPSRSTTLPLISAFLVRCVAYNARDAWPNFVVSAIDNGGIQTTSLFLVLAIHRRQSHVSSRPERWQKHCFVNVFPFPPGEQKTIKRWWGKRGFHSLSGDLSERIGTDLNPQEKVRRVRPARPLRSASLLAALRFLCCSLSSMPLWKNMLIHLFKKCWWRPHAF